MEVAKTNCLRIYILVVLLLPCYHPFPQNSGYPYKDWIKTLSEKSAPANTGFASILSSLKGKDEPEVSQVFNQLESQENSAYYTSKFYFLKAMWFWGSDDSAKSDSTQQMLKKALNTAYETNDDRLVSDICWYYGSTMYWSGNIEPASMYSLYAAELDEKKGRTSTPYEFSLLGDVLYKTRDYEKSIYYNRKAIATIPNLLSAKSTVMSLWNTIALCWQRMDKYDSAFFDFSIAMKMAIELKDSLWMSIISGNEGQIYFMQKNYPMAKKLLEYDYRFSKKSGELASAANSLQWVARINLIQGNKAVALQQVKEALGLLKQGSSSNYLENVYYAAADAYRAAGNNDSSYKYARLYNQVHDKNERTVANSRLEIARIKLENLQSSLTIKSLQKEKEAEKLKRNFLLAIILILTVFALFILNWQRTRLLHKKQLAEAASESAKEQLEMLRQSIVEKTDLIEKLQTQTVSKETTAEQLEIVEELSQQTILTEEDWGRFKKLFEKIYPAFFFRLREKAIDITLAEQRMAALIRLHLTSRQMASMLGISVDSVHKTRQRLRQRLNIDPAISLEESIAIF